jgi:hypothetical protein
MEFFAVALCVLYGLLLKVGNKGKGPPGGEPDFSYPTFRIAI